VVGLGTSRRPLSRQLINPDVKAVPRSEFRQSSNNDNAPPICPSE